MNALALFELNPNAFDLVLTDVTMPGMTGDRLGRNLMERRPDLPVLLMTGYTKILTDDQAKEQGFRLLLTKPVPQKDLLVVLRAIFDEKHQRKQ